MLLALASLALPVTVADDAAGSPMAPSVADELHELESSLLGREHAEQHARERAASAAADDAPAESGDGRIAAMAVPAASGPFDRDGRWGEPFALPETAIHAVLMPTGKVLVWGRPRGAEEGGVAGAAIWDPATGVSKRVRPPATEDTNGDGRVDGADEPANIYCSGMSLLADGRVFLAGGQLEDMTPTSDYKGLLNTFVFDPWTERWTVGPSMRGGRWYPTQVQLPNGEIVIASGLNETGKLGANNVNPMLEVYTPEPGGPGRLTHRPAGDKAFKSLYPHLHTLPDGDVLLSGPDGADSAILDPEKLGSGTAGSAWSSLNRAPNHYGGTAIMRPSLDAFDGAWTAMQIGGHADYADGGGVLRAIATAHELDASPAGRSRGWRAAAGGSLQQARYYGNTVILPDAALLEVGGGSGVEKSTGNWYIDPATSGNLRKVEILEPGASSWRLGAEQQEWRTYHSTALLLPDGSVLSAGDDVHEGPDPLDPYPDPTACPPGETCRRDSGEVYSPPYLFDGDDAAPRPVIRGAASAVRHGATFGVWTPDAASGSRPVTRAVLVAPSAVTHSTDMNQRLVPLRIAGTLPGRGLNLVAPHDAAVAPSGWYMLFLLDSHGTPSVARWVHLSPDATAAAVVTAETQSTAPVAAAPPADPGKKTPSPRLRLSLSAPSALVERGLVRIGLTLDQAARVTVTGHAGRGSSRAASPRRLTLRRAGTRSVTLRLPALSRLAPGRRAVVVVGAVARNADGKVTRRTVRRTIRRPQSAASARRAPR